MKANVVFSPVAEQDLFEILDYIAQDNQSAAVEWIDFLEDRCRSLADFPYKGRARDDLFNGALMLPIRGYLVFYRVQGDVVEILAVVEGSRDPETIAQKIRGAGEAL